MSISRNGFLNFMKFVASIVIVFHHYQLITGASFSVINFANDDIYTGGNLVELFFVISGFLSFSYISKIKNGYKFSDFYIRKLRRLLPAVALSTILTTILKLIYKYVLLIIPYGEISIWNIFISCLGIQCGWVNKDQSQGINETLWYVSVLLLCYIVFYVATKISNMMRINCIYVYIFITLFSIGIREFGINLPFINYFTARGYFAFFIGVILALLINEFQLIGYNGVKNASVFIYCLFCLFYSLVHYLYRKKYILDIHFFTNHLNYIKTLLEYPALIIISYIEPIKRIANNQVIHKLGQLSFDIYGIFRFCI